MYFSYNSSYLTDKSQLLRNNDFIRKDKKKKKTNKTKQKSTTTVYSGKFSERTFFALKLKIAFQNTKRKYCI